MKSIETYFSLSRRSTHKEINATIYNTKVNFHSKWTYNMAQLNKRIHAKTITVNRLYKYTCFVLIFLLSLSFISWSPYFVALAFLMLKTIYLIIVPLNCSTLNIYTTMNTEPVWRTGDAIAILCFVQTFCAVSPVYRINQSN